jgi:hypothetical protein
MEEPRLPKSSSSILTFTSATRTLGPTPSRPTTIDLTDSSAEDTEFFLTLKGGKRTPENTHLSRGNSLVDATQKPLSNTTSEVDSVSAYGKETIQKKIMTCVEIICESKHRKFTRYSKVKERGNTRRNETRKQDKTLSRYSFMLIVKSTTTYV